MSSDGAIHIPIGGRIANRFFRFVPVLLPLLVLIVTGLRGLDFGAHWDERGYQIKPVKTMIESGILLPQYYGYPSFNYWVSIAALTPDVVAAWPDKENRLQRVLKTIEGYPYLLRLRTIFLVITSLSVLWVYILVLKWRESWIEAFLAGSFLAFSWEVAYHLRWIATDGMLMQFGALTLLFTLLSRINSHGRGYLPFAAIAAGLGCGTKYPGGLLLLPVLVAGYLIWNKGPVRHGLTCLLVKLAMIGAAAYLITTPATVLQPTKFLEGLLYEVNHYASGHAGHTVSPGLEHGWRIFAYLSSVLFSPYMVIAFLFFALCAVGAYALVKESPATAILFLCFPLLYLLYFCTQRAMIARNLLVVAPFMAVLAARGTISLWDRLKLRDTAGLSTGSRKLSLLRTGFATAITASLIVNAGWLVYAAETVVDRNTDRFVREVGAYILAKKDKRFLLSPRVRIRLARTGPIPLENIAEDPADAQLVVLYASEGVRRWQDWPANRAWLTETWFGPYEINFNVYPNWWGDDRIIVMTMPRAKEIGILPVSNYAYVGSGNVPSSRSSPHAIPTSDGANTTVRVEPALPSWQLPKVDPCMLVTGDEAEGIMGPLQAGPKPGGSVLDGISCLYVGSSPLIARIGVISTAAFELHKSDPGNAFITGLGDEAYGTKPGPFEDINLFVHQGTAAILISVFAGAGDESRPERSQIAQGLARKAMDRLIRVMR